MTAEQFEQAKVILESRYDDLESKVRECIYGALDAISFGEIHFGLQYNPNDSVQIADTAGKILKQCGGEYLTDKRSVLLFQILNYQLPFVIKVGGLFHFTKILYLDWIPTLLGLTSGVLCEVMTVFTAPVQCDMIYGAVKLTSIAIISHSFSTTFGVNNPVDFKEESEEVVADMLLGLGVYGALTLTLRGSKYIYVPVRENAKSLVKAAKQVLFPVIKACAADGTVTVPPEGLPEGFVPNNYNLSNNPHFTVVGDEVKWPAGSAQDNYLKSIGKSGIKLDAKNYAIFEDVAHEIGGKKMVFDIPGLTGSYETGDFVKADKIAGIDKAYRDANGLTWHHHQNGRKMILVKRALHDKTIGGIPHKGGVRGIINFIKTAVKACK